MAVALFVFRKKKKNYSFIIIKINIDRKMSAIYIYIQIAVIYIYTDIKMNSTNDSEGEMDDVEVDPQLRARMEALMQHYLTTDDNEEEGDDDNDSLAEAELLEKDQYAIELEDLQKDQATDIEAIRKKLAAMDEKNCEGEDIEEEEEFTYDIDSDS